MIAEKRKLFFSFLFSLKCTDTHWEVLILRLEHQPGGGGHVMILQWGLVIVGDCQRVARLDEEVVVEAAVLVVVHHGRPIGGHLLLPVHGATLQHTAVAQQHVAHLNH